MASWCPGLSSWHRGHPSQPAAARAAGAVLPYHRLSPILAASLHLVQTATSRVRTAGTHLGLGKRQAGSPKSHNNDDMFDGLRVSCERQWLLPPGVHREQDIACLCFAAINLSFTQALLSETRIHLGYVGSGPWNTKPLGMEDFNATPGFSKERSGRSEMSRIPPAAAS